MKLLTGKKIALHLSAIVGFSLVAGQILYSASQFVQEGQISDGSIHDNINTYSISDNDNFMCKNGARVAKVKRNEDQTISYDFEHAEKNIYKGRDILLESASLVGTPQISKFESYVRDGQHFCNTGKIPNPAG